MKVKIKNCKRCGFSWLPRILVLPKRCPRCKRQDWNSTKLGVGGRKKMPNPKYMQKKVSKSIMPEA